MNLAALPRVAPAAVPKQGSFFSLHRRNGPPLPFFRPEYVPLGLPVYSLGGNRFLVDDTSLDWAAIEAERRVLQAAAAVGMSVNGESLLEGGGGCSLMSCAYGPNDLWLEVVTVTNQTAVLTLHSPVTNGVYDLYFVPDLNYQRWHWRRVFCGVPGQTNFALTFPDPNQGYFVALDAADDDGDGLGNGYESWFNYAGNYTSATNSHSDSDEMADGWEVEYGLNPNDATGANGFAWDADGDLFSNGDEYGNYDYTGGRYDPLRNYYSEINRPVVSLAVSRPVANCDPAILTFSRSGNYTPTQDVYYAVGGDLCYGVDYSLTPTPAGQPRIFSVHFPDGYSLVEVAFALLPGPVATGQRTRFAAALTPYGVAADPQVEEPAGWAYVVDIHQGHDRVEFELDFDGLRPVVNDVAERACPGTPTTIKLEGSGACGDGLIFEIVTAPAHGFVGAVTQNGTDAEVIYTSTNSYCGPDEFTFRAKGRILYSLPATANINVGHQNAPLADCQTVLTLTNTPIVITLTGTDLGCGGNLSFTIADPPGSGTGSLGPVTQYGTYATVTYTPPNAIFEGAVVFYFKVTNNCGDDSLPQCVVIGVTPPPTLAIECRRNRLLLSWSVPDWVVNNSLLSQFRIYRCESTSPGCTPSVTPYHTVNAIDEPGLRFWVDQNVDPAKHYCYAITFGYRDACTAPSIFRESPRLPKACAQTCKPPVTPTDIVFIVDNTTSVDSQTVLAVVKAGIVAALDDIEAASSSNAVPDYRLALVTPDNDQVHVRLNFSTNNRALFETAIGALPGIGTPAGGGDYESTDECLLTAVAARAASDPTVAVPNYCTRPAGYGLPLQISDFAPAYAKSRKLAVLITDRPPGGFCDPVFFSDSPYGNHALAIAGVAHDNSVKVNGVQVFTTTTDLHGTIIRELDPAASTVMQSYAQQTCGWYSPIPSESLTVQQVREAVLRMVYAAIVPCQ